MKHLTGKELKSWIDDDQNLKDLYKGLQPSLTRHVKKNGGNEQEAKDLFQESLIILYRKSQEPGFVLTSSVETFVFAIAKRKWLAELRKKTSNENYLTVVDEEVGNDLQEMVINHEKQELFLKHFEKLSANCKELLQLFFHGLRMKEIANHFGYASEGYARKRKHQCQGKLVEAITKDPAFNELRNERE